jgi:hypothetical protein
MVSSVAGSGFVGGFGGPSLAASRCNFIPFLLGQLVLADDVHFSRPLLAAFTAVLGQGVFFRETALEELLGCSPIATHPGAPHGHRCELGLVLCGRHSLQKLHIPTTPCGLASF